MKIRRSFIARLIHNGLSAVFFLMLLTASANGLDQCGNVGPTCGGPSNAPEEKRCYPRIIDISAGLCDIEQLDSNLWRLTFSINFSAEGYHSNNSHDFVAQIRAFIDEWNGGIIGGRSSIDVLPYNSSNTCATVRHTFAYTVTVSSSARKLKLVGFAYQKGPGEGCYCFSDTSYFDIDLINIDTLALSAIPTPEELGPISCEAQVADPISASTGNMFLEREDFTLPDDLGLSMSFRRFYNSFSYDTSGSFHHNWRHTFDYALRTDSITGDVVLVESTGRNITFRRDDLVKQTGDTIRGFSSSYGVLYRLLFDPFADEYTVVREDDVRLVFDGEGPVDRFEDLRGNSIDLVYSGGRLDSVYTASGRRISFDYSDSRLAAIKDSDGQAIVAYSYSGTEGLLERVIFADSSWENYEYGDTTYDSRSIVRITNSGGFSTGYAYDESGLAISNVKADTLNRAELMYQFPSAVGYCRPASDTIKSLVELQNGLLESEFYVDWSPDFTRRHVTGRKNAECAECGTEYTYDGSGLKKTMTYANDRIDALCFDSHGNLLTEIRGSGLPLSQQVDFTYDSRFNKAKTMSRTSVAKSSSKSNPVQLSSYTFDANGNVTQLVSSGWLDSTHSFSYTTNFTYSGARQLQKIDGPRIDVADTTTFYYYANGDLRYVRLANGDLWEMGERDLLGRPTWSTSPNGETTRYQHDARGRLTQLIRQAGQSDSDTSTFSYAVDGKLTEVTLPNGGESTYHYGAAGLLDSIFNSLGEYIATESDSVLNLVRTRIYDSSSSVRKLDSYQFDTKRNVTAYADAHDDSTRFFYDSMGDVDSVRDAEGRVWKYTRDALGRLISKEGSVDGQNCRLSFSYDKHNNLTQVLDPDSNAYAYRYDDAGRLTYDSCAVTGVTKHRYDPASNRIWTENGGGDSIVYQYDALNRLTAVIYPDSTNEYYVHDGTEFSYGKGRLYKDSTSAVVNKYRYDVKGRLYQEIRKFPADTINYITTYTYDLNDNLKTLSYPSGNVIEYFYDSSNNVSGISTNAPGYWMNIVDSVSYAPFGEIEKWRLGNGIKMTNRHNLRYEIDSISTDTTSLIEWLYNYDGVGNITEVADLIDTVKTRRFSYDELSRLVLARCRDFLASPQVYNYELNGNRAFVVPTDSLADTIFYNYASNKLSGLSGADSAVFTYDALGNVLSETRGSVTFSYVYDDAGRLLSYSDSATTTGFAYDAYRRRVKKTYGGSNWTKYINNAAGQILYERISDDTQIDYVYLNGKPVARFLKLGNPIGDPGGGEDSFSEGDGPGEPSSTMISYYHNDHLGTPWFMTNSNQLVIWSGGYYPFGEIYEETVSSSNFHHSPGQYRDAQTDLRYNWHRYYSPELGRYYQADPIGLKGGVNLYAYVSANPLRRIDPAGLDYYETPNGDLVWVESTEMYLPSVGKWRGRVLRDVYGEIVDYRIDPFIPNYSDNYHGCGEEILNKEIGNNPLQIYDSWTNKGPFDIKNQPPFSEGQLVIVDGRIYRSEDLGNMLFGVFAQNSVYPMVLMELGGGIVQALKDGKVHFEWWRTALDDPRGNYFVNRGRIQANVWNNEQRLPH